MRPRIYLDASVVGGLFDEGFREFTEPLFSAFQAGTRLAVISDLLLFELEAAPDRVRVALKQLEPHATERVYLSEESIELAEAYLRQGVVPGSSLSDARHVAIATVERVDVLVSWNFGHLLNLWRIRQFQADNLKLGYPMIEIRSPREVVD